MWQCGILSFLMIWPCLSGKTLRQLTAHELVVLAQVETHPTKELALVACEKVCQDKKECRTMDDKFVPPKWSSMEGTGQAQHSGQSAQKCIPQPCNQYFYPNKIGKLCNWCWACPAMKNEYVLPPFRPPRRHQGPRSPNTRAKLV